MNASLVTAAVLFGPAAVAGPVLAITWWRHRGEYERALAVFAEQRPAATPAPDGPPPDGGMPTPAPVDVLADVIPLHTRRAA